MRLRFNKRSDKKMVARLKKRVKLRKRVAGDLERPRLSVFRSANQIYAQIVDDIKGHTLVSACSLKVDSKDKSKREIAHQVGVEVAKKALEKKISKVVFDRSGYLYHGRVKALADGAREGGLSF